MNLTEQKERFEALDAKRTPGEWIFIGGDGGGEVVAGEECICDDITYYPQPVRVPDMRLIAEIPAMLSLIREQHALLVRAEAAATKLREAQKAYLASDDGTGKRDNSLGQKVGDAARELDETLSLLHSQGIKSE